MEAGNILHDKKIDKSQKTDSNISFTGLFDKKWKRALGLVQVNTIAAGTLAASMAQIPFADAAPLALNDAVMIIGIADIYGVQLGKSAALSMVGAIAANQAGTSLFKAAVGWIPLLGNGVNASVAVATTEATGMAVTGFCELAYKNGQKPDFSNFKGYDFKEYVKAMKEIKRMDED